MIDFTEFLIPTPDAVTTVSELAEGLASRFGTVARVHVDESTAALEIDRRSWEVELTPGTSLLVSPRGSDAFEVKVFTLGELIDTYLDVQSVNDVVRQLNRRVDNVSTWGFTVVTFMYDGRVIGVGRVLDGELAIQGPRGARVSYPWPGYTFIQRLVAIEAMRAAENAFSFSALPMFNFPAFISAVEKEAARFA